MQRSSRWQRACQLILVITLAGCSRGGLPKVIVSGDVSYKGEPVKFGEILFYPTGNTAGTSLGSQDPRRTL